MFALKSYGNGGGGGGGAARVAKTPNRGYFFNFCHQRFINWWAYMRCLENDIN